MKSVKDSIIVLDDLVPKHVQDSLEQLCMSGHFPWYFNQSSNYTSKSNRNNSIEDYTKMSEISSGIDVPQFIHSVYHHQHQKDSQFLVAFNSLLCCIPASIDTLLRIKLNLNYSQTFDTTETYSIPHVDFVSVDNLTTLIYYVNDSDGDTIIFNEKRSTGDLPNCDKLTIKQRITPKKGRFVMFDGSYLHAGNFPSGESPRIVVNINIIPHKVFTVVEK